MSLRRVPKGEGTPYPDPSPHTPLALTRADLANGNLTDESELLRGVAG